MELRYAHLCRALVVCLAGTMLAAGGCADPDSAVGFDEPAPAARFRAIHSAAATDDQKAIPDLIQMLDSDDPAERVLAIGTLERLTGQSLGYDASASSTSRDAAVGRWVEWYAQQGRTSSHPPGPVGKTPTGTLQENGT